MFRRRLGGHYALTYVIVVSSNSSTSLKLFLHHSVYLVCCWDSKKYGHFSLLKYCPNPFCRITHLATPLPVHQFYFQRLICDLNMLVVFIICEVQNYYSSISEGKCLILQNILCLYFHKFSSKKVEGQMNSLTADCFS